MSENLNKYKNYLHFLPEKEKNTVEKALTIPEKSSSVVNTVVKQINRSRAQNTNQERNPNNGSETFVNNSKRLARVSYNRV